MIDLGPLSEVEAYLARPRGTLAEKFRYLCLAKVSRVSDGDTIVVQTLMNLRGDTELFRARLLCQTVELSESGGLEARTHLQQLIASAQEVVQVEKIRPDKYFGRVVCRVTARSLAWPNEEDFDLAERMIVDGFALPL